MGEVLNVRSNKRLFPMQKLFQIIIWKLKEK
jgi:hypothetical protein